MNKNAKEKTIKGNIYANINEKGFVNLWLDIVNIGKVEVRLCDYGDEERKKSNKKLVYKIYMGGK